MKSIPCPLKENAVKIGEQPAVISGAGSLNYREFDRAVDFSVRRFLDVGVKENDRICIISPANSEYLIVLLALWRIRAIACLVSDRNPEIVINEQCNTVKAKFVLREAQIKRLVDLKGAISLGTSLRAGTRLVPTTYLLDQAATVIFSSGSSAEPKAAQQSIGNHYYNAKGANENIPVHCNDRWFLSLPLYHVSGLGILFRCLLGGAAVVISKKNNDTRAIIDRYKVTHISFVAAQLYRLLSDKKSLKSLKRLKAILLGGSAIPQALLKKAINLGLPIYASYGLTEMSSQVATTGLLTGNKPFLKTKILRYRKVRIADDGEILLSGETLFHGYVCNGKLITGSDRQGWFHSRDIGCLKSNYLFVKGRKDNMFISGGENIFPEEIEQILHKSEFIEQAIVVPFPSEKYGYRPVAFLKPKGKRKISRLLILEYLKPRLPKFKIPDDFYFWPQEALLQGIKLQRKNFIRLICNNRQRPISIP